MAKIIGIIVRLGFAIYGTIALCFLIADAISQHFSLVNLFSYFTIESNILAVISLFIMTLYSLTHKTDQFIMWRGAITLYMLITGIIYFTLLRDVQFTLIVRPWVNFALHGLMPIIMIADWLLALPKKPIAFKRALLWLVFPIVYLLYSLIRGPFVQWYPYPFLDPLAIGYVQVVLYSTAIALGFAAVAWLVAFPAGKPWWPANH